MLTDAELQQLHDDFNNVGIEFIWKDISDEPQASIEEFLSPIILILSSEVFQAYILGIMTNATYELLKESILSIWQRLSGKKLTKVTTHGTSQVYTALDLDISLENRTRVKFKLTGNISDEIKEKCIDGVFNILKSTDWDTSKKGYILIYDNNLNKWIIYEDLEFIKKVIRKDAG